MLEGQAKKGNTPQALKDRPEVPWWYFTVVNDFSRLNKSRTQGLNGDNPLDLKTIITYNKNVSKEPVEFFIDVMQELDSIYLTAKKEKSKRSAASKQGT